MHSTSPGHRLRTGLLALPLLAFGWAPASHGATATLQPATDGIRASAPSAAVPPGGDDASLDKARGGNGNGGNGGGNGHGNGGGNGGGGNGGGNGGGGNGSGHGGQLQAEIHPDVWNTNWEHAEGNVQVFLRGKDAAKIDLDSIELSGDGDESISPRSARLAGGQVVATFSKSDAIGLLDDPKAREIKKLTVSFDVGDESKELTDEVRIVGPATGGGGGGTTSGEIQLNIQPDDWNTNWQRNSGLVHAFLRGPGLADIDLHSIVLVGDDAEADPLKPVDARRVGQQIALRFRMNAAYATLDDPDPGETHTVKIRFSQKASDGTSSDKELSEDVHIVGPPR